MSIKHHELDQNQIKENIQKTGFELEYLVTKKLETNDWIVINSKYYVDDESDKVREVDVVAYKADKVNEILVYTTIIVSCKKSDNNYWSFFCKEKNPNDPNINWQPVENWTNSEELNYFLKEVTGKRIIWSQIKKM